MRSVARTLILIAPHCGDGAAGGASLCDRVLDPFGRPRRRPRNGTGEVDPCAPAGRVFRPLIVDIAGRRPATTPLRRPGDRGRLWRRGATPGGARVQ